MLLLDELPEFSRAVLESLRQPLEDGVVSVGGHVRFPARFQLVGTMNLCPCAGRGDPAVECGCTPQRLAAYRERLSRALLDRFRSLGRDAAPLRRQSSRRRLASALRPFVVG